MLAKPTFFHRAPEEAAPAGPSALTWIIENVPLIGPTLSMIMEFDWAADALPLLMIVVLVAAGVHFTELLAGESSSILIGVPHIGHAANRGVVAKTMNHGQADKTIRQNNEARLVIMVIHGIIVTPLKPIENHGVPLKTNEDH